MSFRKGWDKEEYARKAAERAANGGVGKEDAFGRDSAMKKQFVSSKVGALSSRHYPSVTTYDALPTLTSPPTTLHSTTP
jgi:hypothetical protein